MAEALTITEATDYPTTVIGPEGKRKVVLLAQPVDSLWNEEVFYAESGWPGTQETVRIEE